MHEIQWMGLVEQSWHSIHFFDTDLAYGGALLLAPCSDYDSRTCSGTACHCQICHLAFSQPIFKAPQRTSIDGVVRLRRNV